MSSRSASTTVTASSFSSRRADSSPVNHFPLSSSFTARAEQRSRQAGPTAGWKKRRRNISSPSFRKDSARATMAAVSFTSGAGGGGGGGGGGKKRESSSLGRQRRPFLRGCSCVQTGGAYCPIDQHRVYVTGFSNGAGMTFTLGSRFSDRIAAIAPVSSQSFAKVEAPRASSAGLLSHRHGRPAHSLLTAGATWHFGKDYKYPPVRDSRLTISGRNSTDARHSRRWSKADEEGRTRVCVTRSGSLRPSRGFLFHHHRRQRATTGQGCGRKPLPHICLQAKHSIPFNATELPYLGFPLRRIRCLEGSIILLAGMPQPRRPRRPATARHHFTGMVSFPS